jgi:hypothetical protein
VPRGINIRCSCIPLRRSPRVTVIRGSTATRSRFRSLLKGEPDEKKNWICDFAQIEQRVAALRAELDHNYLNEITGLEVPTLENISRWIWSRLDSRLPGLHRVVVRRGSCGEGCVLHGRSEACNPRRTLAAATTPATGFAGLL